MLTDEKRLFFGLEVRAPWPKELPSGRLLDESHRHLTLAFLGQTPFLRLSDYFPSFPTPPFKIGLIGKFDRCLLLPKGHPHVVAWHINWLEDDQELITFQKQLGDWLHHWGFTPSGYQQTFLPHVTLCRAPFIAKEWIHSFTELPLFVKDIHLYESLGYSKYQSLWSYPITPPFEEIEHTADIAFHVRGTTFEELHKHAQIALAFTYPPLLSYFSQTQNILSLEEIVMDLNTILARADGEIGCPFKAISFHDILIEEEPNLLCWEMIVDV